MKIFKYTTLFLAVFLVGIISCKAYTKDDIASVMDSIKTCDSKTANTKKSLKTSYLRMINERDISETNINNIYNNMIKVKTILSSNDICSVNQKDNISSSVANELKYYYESTNNYILSSPKIVDGEIKQPNPKDKIVIKFEDDAINIYENDQLLNVITDKEKFNDVGSHLHYKIALLASIIITIITLILIIFKKTNTLVYSLLYLVIIALPILLVFKNQINSILYLLDGFNVPSTNTVKNIVIKDEKIVSYPAYGNKYGKIIINDESDNIYLGDSLNLLKKGIGQEANSYLPGEKKYTILSGHNTGLFNNLFDIKKNNTIIIETDYGNFKYKVKEKVIMNEDEFEKLNTDYDLILYTCYPNIDIYGNQRLVIYASLIESNFTGELNGK